MSYFVGLDWAEREHAVWVLDERGGTRGKVTVAHSAAGLAGLAEWLGKIAPPSELRVAIERPTGLLVDTLVERGFTVVPIHPNAVKASRPRYSAAQGKTDLGDAYLLADLLRTDGHRFRALTPLSDETKALRALVRVREDLVAQRVGVTNQLRCLLEQFWPGAAAVFADVDSAIALEFFDRYPMAASASALGEKRMAAFLSRQGYSGRRSAAELVERLRAAPRAVAGDKEAEAKGECVRALVAVLRALIAQIATLTTAMEQALDAHPDGKLLTPLFRSGRVCAAQLVAEVGDDRSRFVSAEQLAAEGGVAPVTRESGKHRAVTFRWACNMRLRAALTTLADTTRHTAPWARALYLSARGRGCDHPHAIRILARAWCRVIWTCWQKRIPYDPEKHGAARAFTLRPIDQEAA